MDGFEVLEQVRAKRCKTPILVLTAVDAVPKILQAFDLGADDYLVKPFILEILLARVGAIARRVAAIALPPASAGGVTLDSKPPRSYTSWSRDCSHSEAVAAARNSYSAAGSDYNSRTTDRGGLGNHTDVKENTLDVYIHGLRSKLEDRSDGHPLIRTVHGSGYMFVAV
jgi:two-component system copper resistance phosphate regulon response regulator CusR